jgi:hypothetical protein
MLPPPDIHESCDDLLPGSGLRDQALGGRIPPPGPVEKDRNAGLGKGPYPREDLRAQPKVRGRYLSLGEGWSIPEDDSSPRGTRDKRYVSNSYGRRPGAMGPAGDVDRYDRDMFLRNGTLFR